MAVARLSALRSKDPSPAARREGGACIVDSDNRVVGIGYDGFPRGCSDDCLPWVSFSKDGGAAEARRGGGGREGEGGVGDGEDTSTEKEKDLSFLRTKEPYVVHAEVNAILNKCSADVAGCTMYSARFPSNECAKVIVQSRIREVVYWSDDSPLDDVRHRASRIIFGMAGVRLRQYRPTQGSLVLDFGPAPPAAVQAGVSAGPPAKAVDGERASGGGLPPDDRARFRDLLMSEAGYDPTEPPTVPKRSDYLPWDTYFMAISFLSAKRSKDPNTQVGACIVDSNRCIVGIGYNGFPRGCSDDLLPWARQGNSDLHKKYPYVCHAEVNAILNKGSADVKGATIYVALFPCNDCAKVIIQAGIKEVVYLNDQYHDTNQCRASRIMFQMAGVKLRQYSPADRNINLSFD